MSKMHSDEAQDKKLIAKMIKAAEKKDEAKDKKEMKKEISMAERREQIKKRHPR